MVIVYLKNKELFEDTWSPTSSMNNSKQFLSDSVNHKASMSSHLMTRHGKAAGRRRLWTPPDERRGQDVQDVLPDEGGTASMYRGGVPGGSRNKDGNAGALRAPARPIHRGDAGGGKTPPPTVSPV